MNLINTRESQFELLRIVAIFMVLIHHSLAVADTFWVYRSLHFE